MKQLLLESFALVFGNDYVALMLVAGITAVVAVVGALSTISSWGRFR